MFGHSLTKMVRAYAHKLDAPIRHSLLEIYKPLRWMPCIFHSFLENVMKNRKKLSVIVEYEQNEYSQGVHKTYQVITKHNNCRAKVEFPRVSCCSVELTASALEELLDNCPSVKRVYLNQKIQALLDVAVPSIKAKSIVRNQSRLTGKGQTIAIVDTGIYPHEDLQGRIVDFVDFINQRTDPYDDNGHGTHCAGDAAGDGLASFGQFQGPAPDAKLIGVKVLNKLGSGSLESVMQGIEWCIAYNDAHPEQKITIMSLSLGTVPQRYNKETDDPLVKYVDEAWAKGIVVCAAAGNEGPGPKTIASPGISRNIITVGALDDKNTRDNRYDDEAAPFSSRGPTIYGQTKPDILAPGVSIVSLRAPGSYLDKLQKGNRIGENYFVLSGTSMATPICAGVVALLLERNPELTPSEVKMLLMQGTDLWKSEDPNIYGAGYLNAENSIP